MTYRTHSPVGAPMQMKDWLAQQDTRRTEQQRHLNGLRDWFNASRDKVGTLASNKEAVRRLAELEKELDGESKTVPEAVLAWLGAA